VAGKRALFGVAGNPPNFWLSEYRKERANSPEWLHEIGLDALEIQCTYGVRMPESRAASFRRISRTHDIRLSIHGPYYISLGSDRPETVLNSINELRKAVDLAKLIGSTRVVFHLGSPGHDRGLSLARAIDALRRFEREHDLGSVRLYPEIDGRCRWLGSLDDLLEVCANVESAYPCLDLAHLHARTQGSLVTQGDFEAVIDAVVAALGQEALEHLHWHMYPIEWNGNGEVRHRAFDELKTNVQLSVLSVGSEAERYLPRFEPLLNVVQRRGLTPRIICEAKDSQDIGALEMKSYYEGLRATSRAEDMAS